MRITFLGTGTSHGVPTIDCMLENHARCLRKVCEKARTNPRHRRGRASVFLEVNGLSLLVDVSPDFREQVLRERIMRIDAVLLTHGHADHIMGIPDIRSYRKDPDDPLPLYGSRETLDTVKSTFDYAFNPLTFVGGGIPRLSLKPVDGSFEICGVSIVPIRVEHGNLKGCFGYRVGDVAYIPDLKSIDGAGKALLRGVKCFIVNCLRLEREHSTHLLLEQSMALAREIRPQRCVFVHMTHDIDYEVDSARLDPWMMFGWDGLKIDLD